MLHMPVAYPPVYVDNRVSADVQHSAGQTVANPLLRGPLLRQDNHSAPFQRTLVPSGTSGSTCQAASERCSARSRPKSDEPPIGGTRRSGETWTRQAPTIVDSFAAPNIPSDHRTATRLRECIERIETPNQQVTVPRIARSNPRITMAKLPSMCGRSRWLPASCKEPAAPWSRAKRWLLKFALLPHVPLRNFPATW
jgi:hypothetical protein